MRLMRDVTISSRPGGTLLRFPAERRALPTIELVRSLLPEYATVYNQLARRGLGEPPYPAAIEAEGRRTGMKMLGDITLPPDPRTAREDVTRWFQPLIDRMLRRLTELQDLGWTGDRQTRHDDSRQALIATTTMSVWRTGTRLLAAWAVLDGALTAHAAASLCRVEQQAAR